MGLNNDVCSFDDKMESVSRMDRLLSIKEAMEILGLGRATLYEMCRTRQIKQVRVGRRVLIPESAVKEFVSSRTVPVME
ncbi:MAG: helix-turn-helix domain-containing protein [Firmicutes bacterium]|nr:helix-turn-helix domain-containing protein [Bacillota bacterium]